MMILVSALILIPSSMIKTTRSIIYFWDRPIISVYEQGVYERMQSTVPEGDGIMAMVFHPFEWDYTRNPIASIDVPGAVSPDPGMPLNNGPEALKQYLLDLSLPYLAIGDFNEPLQCLYHRPLWVAHKASGFHSWKALAPNYLNFMNYAEALEKTNPVIFNERGYRVIKLQ